MWPIQLKKEVLYVERASSQTIYEDANRRQFRPVENAIRRRMRIAS